jgi:putative FmdB family regulatory protein
MPLYEFHCSECQSSEEKIMSMSESAEDVECSSCGKVMSKKFNSVPIHFKGDGFYCTDYKDD